MAANAVYLAIGTVLALWPILLTRGASWATRRREGWSRWAQYAILISLVVALACVNYREAVRYDLAGAVRNLFGR